MMCYYLNVHFQGQRVNVLWKRATLSIEAPPLGNLEGVLYRDFLIYRWMSLEMVRLLLIWAPSLDPDYVRSLSLGAIWNFCEGPGFP